MVNSVTTAPYRFRARVLVHAPIQVVAEQVPPTTGMLTADGPDRCVLVTGSDSLDAVAFHLARLDAGVTILEPPELIARARELAARLARASRPAADDPAGPAARSPGLPGIGREEAAGAVNLGAAAELDAGAAAEGGGELLLG